MPHLIIIGNGFDKAHGLKTDYRDFVQHIISDSLEHEKTYSDLFGFHSSRRLTYEQFLKCSDSELNGVFHWKNMFFYHCLVQLKSSNWSDFEQYYFNMLAGTGHFRDNPKLLNENFEKIQSHLFTYLKTVQSDFKKLNAYEYFFNRTSLSLPAVVVNFNYTDTVAKYLSSSKNIDLIQIHGAIREKHDEIIFGYSANDRECIQLLNKQDNEYLRNIKKYAYKEADNELRLHEFLGSHRHIELSLLGHSCGESDKLILHQIFEHPNVQKIRIYYHDGVEDFRNKQININRISLSDTGRNKIEIFPRSHRMPQSTDSKKEIQSFNEYIHKSLS